jgi:hypothetical protein
MELRRRGLWPPQVPAAVLAESLAGDHRRDCHPSRRLRTATRPRRLHHRQVCEPKPLGADYLPSLIALDGDETRRTRGHADAGLRRGRMRRVTSAEICGSGSGPAYQ